MFFNDYSISHSWQSFERLVSRFLLHDRFSGIRLVGRSHDKGADIIAHRDGMRWLIQVKHWDNKIGLNVIEDTIEALAIYRAKIPVIVALKGFTDDALAQQVKLMAQGISIQLWSATKLVNRAKTFKDTYPLGDPTLVFEKRDYQEEAIQLCINAYHKGNNVGSGLIVMATGLGKTHVACEIIRRMSLNRDLRILIIAHTNELVYQLEKSFWPYLKASDETIVWNGYEPQTYDELNRSRFVFACLNTVANYVQQESDLPEFDLLFVDECHHVGDDGMYPSVIENLMAGKQPGSFLLGVTATPWRNDESDLRAVFGDPLISIDLITGLRKGFLANVDYRMYTDNIDWERLNQLQGSKFSPKKINRTLFISNWDDAVVSEMQKAWSEQINPRAIVFCGTIDHAETMSDRINAYGFCRAEAIYSQTSGGRSLGQYERHRILSDFHDGTIQTICAVDILNEGIDVPDVNIVVFQRVTNSRRIFIQQLGRGLRISKDKDKVLVLDFVSDIRRFAAGIDLQNALVGDDGPQRGRPVRINLEQSVSFRKVGGEDPETATFLRQWLEDVAAIESADENTAVLQFPPPLPGSH